MPSDSVPGRLRTETEAGIRWIIADNPARLNSYTRAMWEALPAGYLDKLWKSQLFRQAYEPDGLRVEEFETYLPAVRTLTQFCESYQEFLAWIAG